MFECKICGKSFDKKESLGGHAASHNINFGTNVSKGQILRFDKILGKKINIETTCGFCKIPISHNQRYNNKETKFCTIECARKYSSNYNRLERNLKISGALKGRGNPDVNIECKECKSAFKISWSKRDQIFCSRSCSSKFNNKQSDYSRRGGLGSSVSQGRRSKNEILFFELCDENFENVTANEQFFDGWDCDIIIHSIKIAISWNGIWHYKKISESHKLEQVKNRDLIKNGKILEHGYIHYIIKDMGSHNQEFVKSEFVKFMEYINSINTVTQN